MTYLQFLLIVHVLGAIVGFGSTFAFAVFPDRDQAERLTPASVPPWPISASR